MKNYKYVLMDNAFYDYHKIEQDLTDRAAKGWHLERAGNTVWKFRRGEPKQVRYEVTFSPAASAYNSHPTESEEELAELCAQAGWVRVATLAQVQIFRSEDPNATPLETDEVEKYRNLRRTMKRHYLPQQLLLIALFAVQLLLHGSTALRHPTRTLSSPLMVTTLGMLAGIIAIYTVILLANLLWLRRARLTVESGQRIPPNRFYRRFRWVIWAFLAVFVAIMLWAVEPAFTTLIAVSTVALFLTVRLTLSLCKYLDCPKWVNFLVPSVVSAFVLILTMQLTIGILNDRLEDQPQDVLPLTLEQLTGETDSHALMLDDDHSILASYQRCWDETEDSSLHYTLIDIHAPLVYDTILNEQERNFITPSPNYTIDSRNLGEVWGAHYARHGYDSRGEYWFICWEDRIITMRTSFPLTEEQIAVVTETLKP